MNDRRAVLYLQIPAAYCRSFGGLRWAQYGEAVEFLDGPDAGRTFALAPEIGQFLAGLLDPGRPCPAFGSVLHLLYLIGLGDRSGSSAADARFDRLAGAFRKLGSPLRNAGELCGRLYCAMPGVADPPEIEDLLSVLNGGGWIPQMVFSHPMLGAMDYAEQPALPADMLETWIAARLNELKDEDIRHWLKFGREPAPVPPDHAVPLPAGGPSDVLATAEARPRLAGLTRLVERLEGALSLPSRPLSREGPRTDGYHDLTTRGSPEQILPMQFALDNEEFLRRFAERELLYFHREMPSRPVSRELVLVLDQGVRTWGDVRLMLAGAAMALVRQGQGRGVAVRLATTSGAGDPIDPTTTSPGSLADLLESSDLSASPSSALLRVKSSQPGALRDVVLLTHPLGLADPDVVTAAATIVDDGSTRVFSVAIDAAGELELAELKRGRPVALTRCRLEPVPAAPAAPAASPPRSIYPGPAAPWRGDIEPIPFPFRCGLLGPVVESGNIGCRLIDFDQSGKRILVMLRYGLLATCCIDGSETEILPRPFVGGEILVPLTSVMGVAGGFVVIGLRKQSPALAHYDFAMRTCTVHVLDRPHGAASWIYLPDLHTIVGEPESSDLPWMALDLAEGAGAGSWRAKKAISRCQNDDAIYPLPSSGTSLWKANNRVGLAVRLDGMTGSLEFVTPAGERRSLIPMADGEPALKSGHPFRPNSPYPPHLFACQGDDVLAVQLAGTPIVWFIAMSSRTVIGNFSLNPGESDMRRFALSRDGSRFARSVRPAGVEVRDVPGSDPPVMVETTEPLRVLFAALGRSCLLVRESDTVGPQVAGQTTLIRWDREQLETTRGGDAQRSFESMLGGGVGQSRSLSPESQRVIRDRVRFVQMAELGALRVLIDQFNHVVVQRRDGRTIVIFYLSGDEFAAWTPGGTCLGSQRLIGRQPTSGAARRIAAALRSAQGEKRGVP